ncbi:MAG: hypothetical protein IJC20_03010 [Clostridia bacterium]|nr:hypothetical protein [Clostridia bacterium]
MKNRTSSIHLAMMTRRFSCHKCGQRLEKQSKTRTVKREDPEYKKHSRILGKRLIGDVELTEYEFFCPSCKSVVTFDEQRVTERIQKHIGKNILSQTEIDEYAEKAKAELTKKDKTYSIFVKILTIAVVFLALWLWLESGNGSFKLRF